MTNQEIIDKINAIDINLPDNDKIKKTFNYNQ